VVTNDMDEIELILIDQVWDHESGEYMRTLKGHTNTINSVSFAPTGNYLASCSTDLSIKLWDVSTYACLRTLRGHDHTISTVRFLPLAGLGTPNSGAEKTSTGVNAAIAGAQHLLSGSRDGTVKLWDVETSFCDHTFADHTDWVRCLAVRQSDGALWASSGNDQTIFVYDNTKSKVMELRGHDHVVESLAFVTEEPLKTGHSTQHVETIRDYLASGSRDRTVRLWKVSEGTCLATFKAHENWVRCVVIHPSGNYIISCSDDKSIRVFDIKNNRCLRTLDNAHNHFVTSLDMHHTLPILVSGSVDQTIRCWQLQ
jgi:platelet-activating factor acetylhydrolase IB subunit alpha